MPTDVSFTGLLAFIEANPGWAGLIFGLLAFGESLAVIGILVPAAYVMMACGALVGAGTLSIFDLWIGGTIGAVLGDVVSYAVGRWLGPRAMHVWPLKNYPQHIEAGHRLFERWGWAAVFFGRFAGPFRSMIPLVAGMLEMPVLRFQIANVTSAIVWIPVMVAPTALAGKVYDLARSGHAGLAAILGIAGLVGLGLIIWLARRHGGKLMRDRDPTP